jgi:uncharacterized membrane protein YhfC
MDFGLRLLSALIMIALPIGVGLYLRRRWTVSWKLVLVGGAVFLLAQAAHIPFNAAVLNPYLARLGFGGPDVQGWPLAVSALLLGLSAGIFEEGARYLTYRFWLRQARTFRQGVVFGLGHGGAEAIVIGILALLQHVQLFAMRGQDLSTIVPADQLEAAAAQVEAYWGTPTWAFFLSTVERASALAIQISLSVIVLQAVTRPRGGLWLLAAIGWHALVDAGAVFTGILWGTYRGLTSAAVASEILVAGFALASLYILTRLRPADGEPEGAEPPQPSLPPPPGVPPGAGPVRPERVDETRYLSE